MTLDEAIKHAREVAERIQKDADKQKGLNHGYYVWRSDHANEYRQRAEWLEELKDRRETNFNYVQLMDCRYKDGYSKAIDDFTKKISIYGTYDYYGNVVDVLEIAEKLKKECAE